jgi:hypothetical protein
VLEGGEDCDGDDLGDQDCTDFGFSTPDGLACEDCTIDASGCEASCDGELLETGEDCDGQDLGDHDCTELGYVEADGASCTDACLVDFEGCVAECGNDVVEPGEQCEGEELGCDECQLSGETCATAIPIELALGGIVVSGTTAGGGQHATNACTGEQTSPDRIYSVTPLEDGFLTLSLSREKTEFDSILYVISDCLNPESAAVCANSTSIIGIGDALTGGEVISLEVEEGEPLTVVVDGAGGKSGNYELGLDLSRGTCDDPVTYPIWSGTPMNATANTQDDGDDGEPGASAFCSSDESEDIVYEIVPQQSGGLTMALGSAGFDSVLYARSDCDDERTELQCSHTNGNGGESITLLASEGDPIYLWVDGFTNDEGTYRMSVTPPP